MKPIVLGLQVDGTVKVTVEEVQKMLEDAYQQGYADGKASAQAAQWPYINTPTWQKDSIVITCKTPDVML